MQITIFALLFAIGTIGRERRLASRSLFRLAASDKDVPSTAVDVEALDFLF